MKESTTEYFTFIYHDKWGWNLEVEYISNQVGQTSINSLFYGKIAQ